MRHDVRARLVDNLQTWLLGESAEHAAVWTASGAIAVTWTQDNADVNVTLGNIGVIPVF